MKKNSGTGVNTGGVSLLVIFVLLCLTTFATLSLVSARADLRLTERTAESVKNYYAADSAAEDTLSVICRCAEKARAGDGGSFAERCMQLIEQDTPGVAAEPADDGVTFSYSVHIDDNRTLFVSVTADESGKYRITRWQTEFTGEWESDDSIDLWDGGLS